MIAKNCTIPELQKALESVNALYDGNIVFKRFPERISNTRIRFTLTVKSSRGLGARRGFSGKRVAAACCHVHGYFFDALPESARVIANGREIVSGQEWQDSNIGSVYNPLMYSQACDCHNAK